MEFTRFVCIGALQPINGFFHLGHNVISHHFTFGMGLMDKNISLASLYVIGAVGSKSSPRSAHIWVSIFIWFGVAPPLLLVACGAVWLASVCWRADSRALPISLERGPSTGGVGRAMLTTVLRSSSAAC